MTTSDNVAQQRCSICGEQKTIPEFPVGRKDCKACRSRYRRAYYERTRALEIERTTEFRRKFPDKVRAAKRRHLLKYRERELEKTRNRGLQKRWGAGWEIKKIGLQIHKAVLKVAGPVRKRKETDAQKEARKQRAARYRANRNKPKE